MRNFLTISYLGSNFNGWQRQPAQPSVQESLENALSILLHQPTSVVGCGRTDTGVHARFYVAHFDFENGKGEAVLPEKFLLALNGILPPDIAAHAVSRVEKTAHARFDAFERSYEYHISLKKDPFSRQTTWQFGRARLADLEKMNDAARLFLEFTEFKPFSKTDGSASTTTCFLRRAEWLAEPGERLVFRITSNRFLRGMVRLVVGACLNVGFGKTSLDELRSALETQQPLRQNLSVPPQGLFLTDVCYPFEF